MWVDGWQLFTFPPTNGAQYFCLNLRMYTSGSSKPLSRFWSKTDCCHSWVVNQQKLLPWEMKHICVLIAQNGCVEWKKSTPDRSQPVPAINFPQMPSNIKNKGIIKWEPHLIVSLGFIFWFWEIRFRCFELQDQMAFFKKRMF